MDIALHRGQNDGLLFDLRVGFGDGGLDQLKRSRGSLRAHQKLGQIQPLFLKAAADLVQRGDDLALHQLHRRVILQCKPGGLGRSAFHAPHHSLGKAQTLRLGGCGAVGLLILHIGDVIPAARVCAQKGPRGVVYVHHRLRQGVHDGGAQPLAQRHREEGRGDLLPVRQSEGDVGHAHAGAKAPRCERAHAVKRHGCGVAAGRDGERKRVKDQITRAEAVLGGPRQDLVCNGKPAPGRLGDALLVQKQGHRHAAVAPQQRENGAHALVLAADGVDQRLAVVAAHGALERDRVRGVELQRQIRDLLQGLHHQGQHLGLVQLRQTHVHVQHLDAPVLLLGGKAQDVVDIPAQKRLLEALFPGGIDPLANQNGVAPQRDAVRVGAHAACLRSCRGRGEQIRGLFNQRADIVRRGAAAAAQNGGASAGHPLHTGGKLIRPNVVDSLSVHVPGKSGVWVYDHGHRGYVQQPWQKSLHLDRPQRAVHAQRVHTQALEQRDHRLGVSAGHQLAALVVHVCDEDRQIAVFLCRKDRGLGLIGVVHGLDQNEIRPGLSRPDHLSKQIDRSFKIEVAQRL